MHLLNDLEALNIQLDDKTGLSDSCRTSLRLSDEPGITCTSAFYEGLIFELEPSVEGIDLRSRLSQPSSVTAQLITDIRSSAFPIVIRVVYYALHSHSSGAQAYGNETPS